MIMKKSFILALLLILTFTSCNKQNANTTSLKKNDEPTVTSIEEKEKPQEFSEYFRVNSPEGIKVREKPDLTSKRLTGLTNKTVVKLLQKGPEETIDNITANWFEIELPQNIAKKENVKTGWVFGGYMIKNNGDSIPAKYFLDPTYTKNVQQGMASIGSYIMPKQNENFNMYTAPSKHAEVISSFNTDNIGIILRACPDMTPSLENWYYILNQSNGQKGWICSKNTFISTADGFKTSDTKKTYIRKNAEVEIEAFPAFTFRNYMSNACLCADGIHYVTRTEKGTQLEIYNRNNNEKECIDLYNLDGSNDSESRAFTYSKKSDVVYFGWAESLYSYSLEEGTFKKIFTIDPRTQQNNIKEGDLFSSEEYDNPYDLGDSFVISKIYVSKDERYFYLELTFNTGTRYIPRMMAYDDKTGIQKIMDYATPESDSDHYYSYGPVDFDENNNAVYTITNNQWIFSNHVIENALITVSSNSENWPSPVLKLLPKNLYSDRTIYMPGGKKILCCGSRFCLYDTDAKFNASYRFTTNTVYDYISGYDNFRFNEDKSICAVLDGHGKNACIAFYSTKTFNLLFALHLDIDSYYLDFWWDGKFLLVKYEIGDDYQHISYNINIKEKENQISDNAPLSEEEIALCAKIFTCNDDGDIGYCFSFAPDGTYMCYNYYAMSEAEDPIDAVIGGYEIIGDNLVHLYPYFAAVPFWGEKIKDISGFDRFNLITDTYGIKFIIGRKPVIYNRFGNIFLYDAETLVASTYDWDIGVGAYGVEFEKAASIYFPETDMFNDF